VNTAGSRHIVQAGKDDGATVTVTLNAEAPVVNTERQDFTTTFNQVALENLPINGRRWFKFALALFVSSFPGDWSPTWHNRSASTTRF
jgi:hypothetical protein